MDRRRKPSFVHLFALLQCCHCFHRPIALNQHDRKKSNTVMTMMLTGSTTNPKGNSILREIYGPFDESMLEMYWGRYPLLIRGAFDPADATTESWPSWEEIVSLACYNENDDDNEVDEYESGEMARLITHIPGQVNSFDVELGPFYKDALQSIMKNDTAEKKWTILVNDVDHFIPAVSFWMNQKFSFLPRWRRDDAQISLAGIGGGIGPHVDNYDVFLVQTSGKRKWVVLVDEMLPAQEEKDLLVPDIPVSILQLDQQKFSMTEVILQEGDMLYLPPRVVHWGTATTCDCMTLSVGCRAPSAAELLARVAETVQQSLHITAVKRYTDPNLIQWARQESHLNSPSLSSFIKDSMKELVQNAIEHVLEDEAVWDSLIGGITTETVRYSENPIQTFDQYNQFNVGSLEEVTNEILVMAMRSTRESGRHLFLTPRAGISFATSRIRNYDSILMDRIFANGRMWEVQHDETSVDIFRCIERGHALDEHTLSTLKSMATWNVLEELVHHGLLQVNIVDDNVDKKKNGVHVDMT